MDQSCAPVTSRGSSEARGCCANRTFGGPWTTKIPRTMPSSWVCCLLPLAGVLLLGQPTQAEEYGFQSRPGPPPKPKASNSMWQKQKDILTKQVLQAQAQVLLHMNKKHNATFFMAPGETTQMMVQTVFGHVYHVRTVLMHAECPEHYTDDLRSVTAKDCKVQPDSPKLLCNIEVIELFGMDAYIISGEDCHEYIPPANNSENSADSTNPSARGDEEENYYM